MSSKPLSSVDLSIFPNILFLLIKSVKASRGVSLENVVQNSFEKLTTTDRTCISTHKKEFRKYKKWFTSLYCDQLRNLPGYDTEALLGDLRYLS